MMFSLGTAIIQVLGKLTMLTWKEDQRVQSLVPPACHRKENCYRNPQVKSQSTSRAVLKVNLDTYRTSGCTGNSVPQHKSDTKTTKPKQQKPPSQRAHKASDFSAEQKFDLIFAFLKTRAPVRR